MVFGAPVPGFDHPDDGGVHESGERFGGIFFSLFAALWQLQPFPVPTEEDIPPALCRQLECFAAECGADDGGPADRASSGSTPRPGSGSTAWSRWRSSVTSTSWLEDAEALFEAELADLCPGHGTWKTRRLAP